MRGWIYTLCLLLVGVCWSCNDYDLGGDDDTDSGGPGGLDDDDDDDDDDNAHDDDFDPDDDDDDDTGVADDDDNGDDDDTTQEPPPELLDECPDKVGYSFVDDDGDGYVAVLSWEPQDSAVIHVDFTGIFHVYDTYIAESGASQINEIGYLTISNSHNPTGMPDFANCESYWIVPDTDNHGTPPPGSLYVGTFPLVAGEDNLLTLNHYCELYRNGLCQSFQNGTPGADGSCDSSGVNSIHMALDSICLVPL
jgi:hypothetical protein